MWEGGTYGYKRRTSGAIQKVERKNGSMKKEKIYYLKLATHERKGAEANCGAYI